MEKVTLPTTLTFIGKDAFKNTAYINNTSAYVKGLLYNENYLIAYNPKYTGLVKIKENVKVITEGVFENVRSIELASDMQTIPNNLFEDCVKLERVVIPEGVTSIGKKVFYGCENLLSVTLPNSLISVGEEAFCACYKLLSIVIPDNVKNIDNYAFCACNSLSSIIIGNSVTSIGKYAFGGCNSVKNIKISKSVTSIGDYAFEGCTSLKTVILPVSLTSIGLRVFFECDSLTHIYYEGTKEEFDKMKTDSLPSCIYFYSETRPSTGNNYWHYIKETPTIWR